MPFDEPPPFAVWRHVDAREGFEVVFFRSVDDGLRIEGDTTGLEEGEAWSVRYEISLGPDWQTRSARVVSVSGHGTREVELETDGDGRWRVNGSEAPELEGCRDVDLESSSFTNAFPVHRLALAVGDEAEAPAAWVRELDVSIERLEQHYRRLDDDGAHQRYDYYSPRDDFRSELVYDEAGLVIDYPGIAVRAG
jgi:uncharacterized protein